jgi:hypothetical protein
VNTLARHHAPATRNAHQAGRFGLVNSAFRLEEESSDDEGDSDEEEEEEEGEEEDEMQQQYPAGEAAGEDAAQVITPDVISVVPAIFSPASRYLIANCHRRWCRMKKQPKMKKVRSRIVLVDADRLSVAVT